MFTNLRKEKELVDREAEIYRREQFLKVEEQIEAYKSKRNREMEDMGRKCMEQLGEYEHDFHSEKEERGIEIAKLQAEQKTLTQITEAHKELLKQKDSEIVRLSETLNLFITNQPKTLVQNSKC